MAVWQFSFNFLPRNKLLKFFGEIPVSLSDDVAETSGLYRGVELPPDSADRLGILGDGSPLKWSSESLNFGDYDNGSHLTIYRIDTNDTEIWGRIHAGKPDEAFVRGVLSLAIACDCLIFTHNDTVIEPQYDTLLDEVKMSGPYRFCNDPHGYLTSDEVKEINWSVRERLRKWLLPF